MYNKNKTMEYITKPSITRLARRAGVKSVSEDCFIPISFLIENHLNELIEAALIVNCEHQTKTMMSDDIFEAFRLIGQNITQSNDLCTSTCSK